MVKIYSIAFLDADALSLHHYAKEYVDSDFDFMICLYIFLLYWPMMFFIYKSIKRSIF